MIIALALIAVILLCLNGGRTVGVWRIIVQVIKIVIAIVIIKLVLAALGLGLFYFVGKALFQ